MSFPSIFRSCALLLLSLLATLQAVEEGVPNTSTQIENRSSRWSTSIDFLVWFASEEVASIWADVVTIGDNTSTWKAEGFDFTWDYGFRTGAGYNFAHDQWDTTLYWTWFRTSAEHRIPFRPNSTISPEFFAAFLSGNSPQSMSAKWTLLFNMFDWELGRSFWVSKGLSLRPFLGLKGGWIYQSIRGKYHNLRIDNIPTHHSGREHLKNNFWGVGPSGGLDTKWKIRDFGSRFLSFFGDFSMATLWGTWICSDVYTNTASQKSSVNTKNAALGALMFRGFMGIGWDADFHSGQSHFAIQLGYEMQLWLNQLRFATFQLQRLHHDLTLQGGTLHCRFDF